MKCIFLWNVTKAQKFALAVVKRVRARFGHALVVVISDSNMSLSASSEDSTSVNVNSGITTNEAVWMKEGDTTEDENSITINAE